MATVAKQQLPLGRSFVRLVRELPGQAKRFWVLVVVTGVVVGGVAAALLKGLQLLQRLLWPEAGGSFLGAVQSASPLHRVLIPTLAGALVVLASLLARRPLRGHGTASIIESIWNKSGRISFGWTVLRGLLSMLAVAMGAPLGREGALLQTGAATGSALATRLRIPPDQARLLVACGTSAGLAAAYNVPIGATLFALEVLIGSFALELFAPLVLSSVLATLVARLLLGDHPAYLIPHYALLNPPDIAVAIVAAPVLGAAAALFVAVVNLADAKLRRLRGRAFTLLPVVVMAAIGVAALWFPELLGNGYDTVNGALLGNVPLLMLLLLPLLKLFATATSAGAGVPGGLFTPSLFYGALLGGLVGEVANSIWPAVGPPGAFALLGMGAALAGTTHAPASAVLIIFELTADYAMILPLMLTAVVAAAVSRRIEPDSVYTAPLRRRNVPLPEPPYPSWLLAKSVRAFLEPAPPTVEPGASLQEAMAHLLEQPSGVDVYVVSPDLHLLGVITLTELKGHIPDHSLLSTIVAADVMQQVQPATDEMSLSEVALLFGKTQLERLPVVDRRGKLLGTIAKGEVLRRGRF